MADADLELARMGGRFNAEQGQILTAQDVDRIGGFAAKSLLNFLAVLFFDEGNGYPISGFPRDLTTTDMCKVSSTSDLGYSVSTGWGMFYDSSAAADEFEATKYRPIVLDTAATGSLAAHDATNPRIDLVCIAPAWEDDQPATRNVKDPSTGVVTSSSIDARRRFSATVQVVTGTPGATPAVPSVPAGYMELARAYVPATSGAAVWKDHRQVLALSQWLAGVPRYVGGDFVLDGDASELEVSATSPASLAVVVETGRASINGCVRTYARETALALTAADATNDRIDLIVAREDNTLDVVDGTPAATPSAPAVPSNAVALAEVLVEATVTSVSNAKITDRRETQAFDGDARIKVASMNHNRLSEPEVFVRLGTPSVSGDLATVSVDLYYPDNVTPYDGPFDSADDPGDCVFLAELFQVTIPVGLTNHAEADTDFTAALNAIQLDPVPWGDASSRVMWFKPDGIAADGFNYGGEPSLSGRLIFWMKEASGTIKIERDNTGGDAGTYVLVVRPVNRPGGATFYREIVFA